LNHDPEVLLDHDPEVSLVDVSVQFLKHCLQLWLPTNKTN